MQAGDLMQDLKTGHLLGAAPKAQFWGQVIGATAGAILSAFIYRIYTAYVCLGLVMSCRVNIIWLVGSTKFPVISSRCPLPMFGSSLQGLSQALGCPTWQRNGPLELPFYSWAQPSPEPWLSGRDGGLSSQAASLLPSVSQQCATRDNET